MSVIENENVITVDEDAVYFGVHKLKLIPMWPNGIPQGVTWFDMMRMCENAELPFLASDASAVCAALRVAAEDLPEQWKSAAQNGGVVFLYQELANKDHGQMPLLCLRYHARMGSWYVENVSTNRCTRNEDLSTVAFEVPLQI